MTTSIWQLADSKKAAQRKVVSTCTLPHALCIFERIEKIFINKKWRKQ
jgi:hypothetical protein